MVNLLNAAFFFVCFRNTKKMHILLHAAFFFVCFFCLCVVFRTFLFSFVCYFCFFGFFCFQILAHFLSTFFYFCLFGMSVFFSSFMFYFTQWILNLRIDNNLCLKRFYFSLAFCVSWVCFFWMAFSVFWNLVCFFFNCWVFVFDKSLC